VNPFKDKIVDSSLRAGAIPGKTYPGTLCRCPRLDCTRSRKSDHGSIRLVPDDSVIRLVGPPASSTWYSLSDEQLNFGMDATPGEAERSASCPIIADALFLRRRVLQP
jgi:hypothetical protein